MQAVYFVLHSLNKETFSGFCSVLFESCCRFCSRRPMSEKTSRRRSCRTGKCLHCKKIFEKDYRNIDKQRYCSEEPCRKASKKASQRKWLNKPENRDIFRGPENVQRVKDWFKANPGRSRRKKGKLEEEPVLQDDRTGQTVDNEPVAELKQDHCGICAPAPQDDWYTQHLVVVGLIDHMFGALQDDIEGTLRALATSGRIRLEGFSRSKIHQRTEGIHYGKDNPASRTQTKRAAAIQLAGPAAARPP